MGAYKLDDPSKGMSLVNHSGEIIASWSYIGLIEHWKKKHARAAYIPSECITTPLRKYRYGPKIGLGIGTNVIHLLNAIACKKIFYDPGIKLENIDGQLKCKRRSQFRIRSKNLNTLYQYYNEVDLS